ncbi:MurR/RpiR family transcriptional regulator [Pediococcus claussenii]|uniref:Helix-turn-helix domain, rpiR family protein n=1 Tax=Pediococcus claussenii (strain ATCC BAA-344 / DSM 14800 / JCM 18046 / KCTC 3811 / LMG 21948 / P06) TaxID=701521 RepID=G8PET6_PEDCP|nr:MurR/RpiR family transcriptional regulator [Pediococcus claussenii]AEV94466.1 helix-turn-helix domain, rpiR family protein [Pediococcus claussenii ATCC BAA-344]ANZ69685.1 RpiR family transcriptional regulator [Pediococcus claussenii]ANZ71502.1 RpiR family transcriptional regulator [Pediococcus claussenii]KRN19827.1 hypothetical protein IV79_GL001116 [Pediococcus claussenii]
MFDYEKVQTLNQLELCVYKYIIAHINEVQGMTIRELSNESHVSSTTILRFLKKMGFDGFSDFKYALRHNHEERETTVIDQDLEPINLFLDQAIQEPYVAMLEQAARKLASADICLLFGLGTSGSLAQYGARMLANYGIYTLTINDPFQPKPIAKRDYSDTLIIFLSVSGETSQVLDQARFYQESNAQTMVITSDVSSTLAQLADTTITYDIPEVKTDDLNLTSQVPVVYILERIGKMTHDLLIEKNSD